MPTEIKLPSLGDGIDSAEVLEVLVSEGEEVTQDQGLMELETDKATVTVPSPHAGKIVKLQVKEGDSVAIGQVFALIETGSGAAADSTPQEKPPAQQAAAQKPQAEAKAAEPPPAAKPQPEPAASEEPEEQPPAKPEPAAQPAAAKAAPAKPAAAPQGGSRDGSTPNTSAAAPQVRTSVAEADDAIPAGPAIRRLAREVGVDLSRVQGTGEYGRITREDVMSVVRQLGQQSGMAPGSAAAVPQRAPSPSGAPSAHPKAGGASGKAADELPGTAAEDDYGPIRVERMSKIRKTIAAQMNKSWSMAPRVVNFDDADITDLEAFRQTSKDDYAARGIKLTTMPFLIKAVAAGLKHHPAINAAIDSENEQIIYKQYVNIGIAVDTPRGLVVPTLKNADRMSIPDIAAALGELSGRVRDNDFAVSDLRGGTFTISNLGAIGGTYSTPIINVPEVAILLVGRSRKLPVVMDDDSIKPRLMMPLSLAYDHRLVDGATAARFLNEVIGYLQAPSRLLLAI